MVGTDLATKWPPSSYWLKHYRLLRSSLGGIMIDNLVWY